MIKEQAEGTSGLLYTISTELAQWSDEVGWRRSVFHTWMLTFSIWSRMDVRGRNLETWSKGFWSHASVASNFVQTQPHLDITSTGIAFRNLASLTHVLV
jgi:hypothetical protein